MSAGSAGALRRPSHSVFRRLPESLSDYTRCGIAGDAARSGSVPKGLDVTQKVVELVPTRENPASPIVARLILGRVATGSIPSVCCATYRVMKTCLASLLIALAAPNVIAQDSKELVLNQPPFAVYGAFWPNLHHLLWAEAWARRPPSEEKAAGALPEPLTADMTAEERRAWDAAVSYYDKEIADLHPLFEMRSIRKAMIAAGADLPAAGLDSAHRQVLVGAAPVYHKYWWPAHDTANRTWLVDPLSKLASLTPAVPERLAGRVRDALVHECHPRRRGARRKPRRRVHINRSGARSHHDFEQRSQQPGVDGGRDPVPRILPRPCVASHGRLRRRTAHAAQSIQTPLACGPFLSHG